LTAGAGAANIGSAMLKICPICRRTWSGGRDCPHCGEGHPLIDVAEPSGRKVFLRDKELASAIRGYYGARTGMLVAFWGILLGLVLALALARKAMVAPAGQAAAWWIAAAVCAVVPFAVAVLASFAASRAAASAAPRARRTSASPPATIPGTTTSPSANAGRTKSGQEHYRERGRWGSFGRILGGSTGQPMLGSVLNPPALPNLPRSL